MNSVEKINAEAWEQFGRWEKRMNARFSECFEDVELLERVDIYTGQIETSESTLDSRIGNETRD
jgi:hypothetical protein